MIRHARFHETAGHQVLVQIAEIPCPCHHPECPGTTHGIQISTVGRFPEGIAIMSARVASNQETERMCAVIQALQPEHFKQLLELLQSSAFETLSELEVRDQLMAVFQEVDRLLV